MIELATDHKINVEALAARLLHRRIMRVHFKLPYTEEQITDLLTACVKAEVAFRQRDMVQSSETASYISRAAQWLKEGKTFGLLMCGMPGNGKTTLMRAIKLLIDEVKAQDDFGRTLSVRLIDAREIARLNRDNYEEYKKLGKELMLGIDDLGLEPTEVLDYGNILNPVIDLLSYRYNEQLFTLATTNLQPQQIREKYKDRIADRFNEMMTKIVFTNGSYRGLKV